VILLFEVTPAQCKAARIILNWTVADLADRSNISVTTVKNFESGKRQTTKANRVSLEQCFVNAKVIFRAVDEPDSFAPIRVVELADGSRVELSE